MCVNYLLVQGAESLFFLDYYATGKLESDVAERVIASIAEGCKQAGCALIGGETAEPYAMYAAGDYDPAGICVGSAEREQGLTVTRGTHGGVRLGLASTGVRFKGLDRADGCVGNEGVVRCGRCGASVIYKKKK